MPLSNEPFQAPELQGRSQEFCSGGASYWRS